MQPLSAQGRTQHLRTLAETTFDVLVIGGGIAGAGVALDAVARGYSVALVEKADFASGTSSKSTKLVHGGLRYLPNLDFELVREALEERRLLLQNTPYLVRDIGFILPLYKGYRHSIGLPFTTPSGIGMNSLLHAGLWLYDTLAGQQNLPRHRHLKRNTILRIAPTLQPEELQAGYMYYDAQTNDARLTLTILHTAARFGAIITNYTEVTGFMQKYDHLVGAYIQDKLSGESFLLRARHIVNATGVFAEKIETLATTQPDIHIKPSKGIHLIFSREKLQITNEAIVLPETEDKRILFIVPWQSRAILGTTDTGDGPLDHPIATQADITYLLTHLNRYLTIKVTEADIISSFAGYRPLVQSRKRNISTTHLSRTHAVLESPTGLVSIVGGTLTTYRRMAQDTVDLLCKRDGTQLTHPTKELLLQGSAAWPIAKPKLWECGRALGLAPKIIEHLGNNYGGEAHRILQLIKQTPTLALPLVNDLPYIKAEVIYACREEMAMTPNDVLARRTAILLEDTHHGLKVVDEVATLMAHEHHWSPTTQERLADAYRQSSNP
jgi:glycerol-3-phosphate dehydrogenase